MNNKSPFTKEELLWIDRIERHPLWERYAPQHIKDAGIPFIVKLRAFGRGKENSLLVWI